MLVGDRYYFGLVKAGGQHTGFSIGAVSQGLASRLGLTIPVLVLGRSVTGSRHGLCWPCSTSFSVQGGHSRGQTAVSE